jgi:hypothetical protein
VAKLRKHSSALFIAHNGTKFDQAMFSRQCKEHNFVIPIDWKFEDSRFLIRQLWPNQSKKQSGSGYSLDALSQGRSITKKVQGTKSFVRA